jgi:hypothetical protein
MARGRPKKAATPEGDNRQGGDADPAKRLNGWRTGHAERAKAWAQRASRAARKRALDKGRADPIFQPFSKRLAPDFAEAISRFEQERGLKRESGSSK